MNADDPKFTAYALGEKDALSASERAEIERALGEDRELRRQCDEIRALSGLLESAYAREPVKDLTEGQKRAIKREAEKVRRKRKDSEKIKPFPWFLSGLAAASLCLLLAVSSVMLKEKKSGSVVSSAKERKSVEAAPAATGHGEGGVDRLEGRSGSVAEVDAAAKPPHKRPLKDGEGVEPTLLAQADHKIDSPKASPSGLDSDNASLVQSEAVSPVLSSEPAGPEIVMADLDKNPARVSTFAMEGSTLEFEESSGRKRKTQEQSAAGLRGERATKRKTFFLKRIGSKERENAPEEQAKTGNEVVLGATGGAAAGSLMGGKGELRILPHPYPYPYPFPEPPPGPIPETVEGTFNTESYDSIRDNPFIRPEGQDALSTFSIDVDTAAYANMRRFLNNDQLPPRDAIRIEELINYFPYDYRGSEESDHPFAALMEIAAAPWKTEHRLVRIALKGKEVAWADRPAGNFVFLIDVSGSMRPANKLPLVKKSLEMLVRRLGEQDRVAIVTYAGQSRVVLPSTTANNTETLLHAVRELGAGGSTYASAGIETAYGIAEKHFLKEGNNRVILCTDGDFNVGTTNRGALATLLEEKAKKGIFLTILGFGMGNLKDAALEELSNRGNGNYAYIDNEREARKVFLEQVSGTMLTIAKDVKIQVEFNPERVEAYRLIGYENRILAAPDFNDDARDAGEIGVGHAVTALYEVVPVGVPMDLPTVDPLKYQQPRGSIKPSSSKELLTLKVRYKEPRGEKSVLMKVPVTDSQKSFADASEDFRFAASVAAFGMILRASPYKGDSDFSMVRSIAEKAQGNNKGGYRSEFLYLIDKAERIMESRKSKPERPSQPVEPLERN